MTKPIATNVPPDAKWWWSTDADEETWTGPYETAHAACAAAAASGVNPDGRYWIRQAAQRAIDLGEFAEAERLYETMQEAWEASDLPFDDDPGLPDLDPSDLEDLQHRLARTVSEWQAERRIVVIPWKFAWAGPVAAVKATQTGEPA